MNRLLTFAAIVAVTGAAHLDAQTVQKISATNANNYGIVYTLPSTVLDITIETELTVKTPGEFYKYAKKYFNIDNPIAEPSRSIDVKSVTVNPRGVAQSPERYTIQLKANGGAPYMILSEDNVPLAINTEEVFERTAKSLPEPQPAAPTALQIAAAQHALGEEISQSQSVAKRAELAAAHIFELRQSRTDLLTGQADQMPPDGQAMQLILDNINAQEAALMAMFTGTVQTSTDVYSLTYTPAEEVSDVIIARISPVDGMVDPDDLSGEPIYLSLAVTDRGKEPVNEKGQTVEAPKNGFIYRIPGKARMTVMFDGNVLSDSQYDIAQYGILYALKPTVFTDRKTPAYVIFDPTTGAIREIGTTTLR